MVNRRKKSIFNKRLDKNIPKNAVFVGMPTKWGNPFLHSEPKRNGKKLIMGMSRQAVVKKFNLYACARLVDEPHWLDALKGRPLICYCYPKACHATTLYHLANKMKIIKEKLIRDDYGYGLYECQNYEIPKDVDSWRAPSYIEDWYELRCNKTGIIVFSCNNYNDAMFQHISFGESRGYT